MNKRLLAHAVGGALLLGTAAVMAHHPILGKFDDNAAMELEGIVSYVDWRNPHAHVFVNVTGDNGEVENWAVELESPIILRRNGWEEDSLKPGDAITVQGMRARDGSRQVWGEEVTLASSGDAVYAVEDLEPPAKSGEATPTWPDGSPALGVVPGGPDGYWAFPSETALVEDGKDVAMNEYGLLENVDDAAEVAPLKPWALGVYKHRQERNLRDDPLFLNCKPPGGPRQYQSPLGFQLLEDKENERVFVLMGSGNHNYRYIFLDERDSLGSVLGDDDNPLYYGRATGRWQDGSFLVTTQGFNEDFWFSNGGLPHTSQLVLEESFTRTDKDTLEYEVTINDPGAYTRPWTASWTLRWVEGEDLPVHYCQSNRP